MSRRTSEGYGIPSGQAPLFQDTSGVPPQPPPMMGVGAAATAQMLNNPLFTAAAQQYGQDLASRGHAIIDSNVNRFMMTSHVKTYFAVDTNYVLKKLSLLLFPYRHMDWSMQYQTSQQESFPLPPRQSLNTPDLYIPVMGFVTYVLLTGLVMGTQQRFSPEQLGMTASSLLAWILAEVFLIWLCLYLLAVHSRLHSLDLFAFCGYKYVGMIAAVGCGLLGGAYVYYAVLGYTALAIAYFLVQSLRLTVQPLATAESASKLRNYFLLLIAVVQPFMMLWLTSGLVGYQPQPVPISSQ